MTMKNSERSISYQRGQPPIEFRCSEPQWDGISPLGMSVKNGEQGRERRQCVARAGTRCRKGSQDMSTEQSEPSRFAAKAKDLQSLRDAVVDVSTVSGALWLSYLFVFFYLGIAAAASRTVFPESGQAAVPQCRTATCLVFCCWAPAIFDRPPLHLALFRYAGRQGRAFPSAAPMPGSREGRP
jgi:hypothetical protein